MIVGWEITFSGQAFLLRGQKLFSMHNLFFVSASWEITVWAGNCAEGVILMVLPESVLSSGHH